MIFMIFHFSYVKAVSNNMRELNRERKYKDDDKFTMLEVIKALLRQRLIEPNVVSMVAIELLA